MKTTALCILDGWGLSDTLDGNAIAKAHTPHFDRLWATCPRSTLCTHGEAVGLPPGSIGNSEVGHLHIGAGRTVPMELQRINAAIESGSFAELPGLRDLAEHARRKGGAVHIAGLVTETGVHALTPHIAAAATAIAAHDVPVLVHAFTDGRDSLPGMAPEFLARLAESLPRGSRIATVCGRYFAMDRDRRWPRIGKAWRAIALGQGLHARSAAGAVRQAVERGESDEFFTPTVIDRYDGLSGGDSFLMANFRSDRVRQLMTALADPEFSEFATGHASRPGAVLGMVPYFSRMPDWIGALFEKPVITETLGECVAAGGRTQFRLAETEKYPHVTFFLNGGRERMFAGEERYMAQSPQVATYDLAPEMAAAEVAGSFAAATRAGHDLIIVNFANPDMVGHTGNLAAAVKACEAADRGLGVVLSAISDVGGRLIVTADHGNCEMMIDPATGVPHTAHTMNPVPVILFGGPDGVCLNPGTLSDLAPTILQLMDMEKPAAMTGTSLLR